MKPISALIVDDSTVMRKIVERSLRQAVEVTQVTEAANGQEALEAFRKNPVDLILCDINMPVMNGLEFIRHLKDEEKAKGVPVVMITTEAGRDDVLEALSNGASGYIRKPFTPEQIKQRVLSVMGEQ